MVQLDGFSPSHINRGHYWKIDSGEGMTTKKLRLYLRSKGYCCNASQRSRLLALYSRCQRGLLSYDRLSVRELKSLIARRGLPISPDQKCTTNVLKAQLEEADEAPFDRFLELPAEIHCQIFEHYFDSYDGSSFERSPIGPQPPITRVSRQLRAEALPLFYSRSCFFLDCSANPRGSFDESSNDFLQNTQFRYFALIRYIKLLVVKDAFLKISIQIDFDAHDCSLRVLDLEVNKGANYDLHTPTRQHLDQLLMENHHALVQSIAPHNGKDKLKKVLLLKERLWQTLHPILDL